jgi:16S rRNA (cytosine967-C5)-methyltransferase
MTPAARMASAIELLSDITTTQRKPADALASDFFRARRFIGAADRRAVSEQVWAVLRAWRRLDWWLGTTADVVTPRLRLAALLLLTGTDMATLESLFSGGRYAPALLDHDERAVLTRLAAHRLDHPRMPEAIRGEVPDFLYPRLAARFGATLGEELAALAGPAPLDLRVNLLKTTREAAQAALAAGGIATIPTPHSPWGLRASGRPPITAAVPFREGWVEIQDEGSQLAAALADARPGMRVADFCAGAGGKTLAMAMMMDNRGHLVACDVSAPRLEGALKRLRRAGVHNAERHLLTPGDKWLKRHLGGFDRVFVDAPCTGTGTWRRNPDARRTLTAADLEELVVRQREILAHAAKLVRKGGRLVYATCSLLPDENEAQVSRFLADHPPFARRDVAEIWPFGKAAAAALGPGPYLNLTPARHATDGFFGAVLERVT